MRKSVLNRFITAGIIFTATITGALANELVVKHKYQDLPPAQLGITPPRFEHIVMTSQGQRLDESFVIYNYNNKPKSIQLTWTDTNSNKQAIKPNHNTLLPWVIINPRSFTIPAKGQQTVRLSLRPPIDFPRKAHFAVLKIEQHIENAIKFNKKNEAVTVTLGSSYGLPIIITTK